MKLGEDDLRFWRNKRYQIECKDAQVIAYDSLGMPALTKFEFGKGMVYYLNFPLENMLLNQSHAFDSNYYKIYSLVFKSAVEKYPVKIGNPFVGMTCHYNEEFCYVVLINYSASEQKIDMSVAEGYEIKAVYGGNTQVLPPHEAVILKIE